jgi:hypothetical protein
MDGDAWFEHGGELGQAERSFAAALRAHAASWPADPARSRLEPPGDGRPLIAWLDVDAPGERLVLLTVGVHLEQGYLRGDRLHNQLFRLPDRPTSLALEASGTADELAGRAAEWFEAILRRPVVRYEWLHAGKVYAFCYLFPDSGETLAQMYNQELSPPGQQGRLIAAGHFHGRGWIDTRGLGHPGRIVRARGERP